MREHRGNEGTDVMKKGLPIVLGKTQIKRIATLVRPQFHHLANAYDGDKNPAAATAKETWSFWRKKPGQSGRYISTAFIPHLVHFRDVPIIDRFNDGAMRHFVGKVSPNGRMQKKSSSNWEDLESMQGFMSDLAKEPGKPNQQVDHFLMMFGKHKLIGDACEPPSGSTLVHKR